MSQSPAFLENESKAKIGTFNDGEPFGVFNGNKQSAVARVPYSSHLCRERVNTNARDSPPLRNRNFRAAEEKGRILLASSVSDGSWRRRRPERF